MTNGRIAAGIGLLAVLLVADGAGAAPPTYCQGGAGCAGSTCPTKITAAQATIPPDACPLHGESQSGVDIFSWNEFIAFNWPATQTCMADTTKSILGIKKGNQGPVVWQTQMSSDDVFVASGQNPAAWCNGQNLAALFEKKPHPMVHASKANPLAAQNLIPLTNVISQPTDVQAVGGVVTDQAQRWIRYERLMNQVEYGAVIGNKWYELSVLNSLSSITLPTGSIEFKSAWKILNPAEIARRRYYTTLATVYNTPDGATSPGPNPVTLGLVGLHIIHKTPSQGGFFWSTFEQVDNDKVFFNPHSSAPVNKQTAAKPFTELNPNGTPINAAVQIKRVNAVPADPNLNRYYQKLLAGTVFANYRLISTQWQFGGAPQGAPANVGNITIETYVQSVSSQGKFKNPSTGCLACHINATTASGKTTTDRSFLFLEAQ